MFLHEVKVLKHATIVAEMIVHVGWMMSSVNAPETPTVQAVQGAQGLQGLQGLQRRKCGHSTTRTWRKQVGINQFNRHTKIRL